MKRGLPSPHPRDTARCGTRPDQPYGTPSKTFGIAAISVIAVAALFSADIRHAAARTTDCLTGTTRWATSSMTNQTGQFTVHFDATPGNSTADGLVGLSQGPGSTFSHFAAIVRFSVKGTIDARSGNDYVAEQTINYTGGRTYHFRVVADVPARLYSAYVTPPNSAEQVIGEDLAFRVEQRNVANLDYWGVYAGWGDIVVCNFTEGDPVDPPGNACQSASTDWQSRPIGPFSNAFTAEFAAIPQDAGIDGLIGLSQGAGTWFTDFAMLVRFSTANRIDVRNEGTFAATNVVGYTPGVKYHFRLVADVTTGKYDVYVQPPSGQEVQIASGYSFRTEQQGITAVDHWACYVDFGSMEVCDFTVKAEDTNQLPTAKVFAGPTSGTAPLGVLFDGSASSDPDGTIVSYAWNFGNGQTATGAKVGHTYITAGTYRATLTVTDDKNAKATAIVTITVNSSSNEPPQAVIVSDTTTGPAPLAVNFDASDSSDPDGTIVSYLWDFGDGSTGIGEAIAHAYTQDGTYTATVTVTDDKGTTDIASADITVQSDNDCTTGNEVWQSFSIEECDDLLSVEFEVTPHAPALDGVVGLSFGSASWYSDLAVALRFNMDDTIDARNGDAYAAVADVTYVPDATYRARLVVDVAARTYDAFVTLPSGQERQIAGDYNFRTEQADVSALNAWTPIVSFGTMDVCNLVTRHLVRNKPPVLAGTVSPTNGEAPLTVQADATGCSDPDGTIADYEWDFGDGSDPVTSTEASHTYTQAGTYHVVLTVTDDAGDTNSEEFSVTASPPADSCITSTTSWQNVPMTAQSGAFTVEFDAIPNADYMDGGFALSSGEVADYPDAAIAVRFNAAGLIDARSGGAYSSDATMAYSAGQTYHFRIAVNVLARSYSVHVTPSGGTEQLIAENYPFRTEQMNVTSLANWAVWSSAEGQTHQVCEFQLGPPPPPSLGVSTRNLDFGLNTTSLPFEVWNAGGSTLNYTISKNAAWLTVSPTSGSSTGAPDTITATVDRTGLDCGSYEGTITITPSAGDPATITVFMQYGTVPQTRLKPIARWDVVPYQRINAGATLNVGVVAFSKYGISRVQFTISGQDYKGVSPINVTQMTLNPQSGVYEYWTPIRANDFTGNGVFTIDAAVYGNDGGYRDRSTDGGGVGLDRLPLVVDATGALPQVQAWVSTSGNDSTGVVNDSSRPFRTVGWAIDRIRAHRSSIGAGNNADGGIVRLMPGTHSNADGGVSGPVACVDEWLTITTAAGGTRSNTILGTGSQLPTSKIALRGITLSGSGVLGMSYDNRTATQVWADDCALVGSGRGITFSHPLSSEFQRLYYTGCSITEVHQATSGSQLCRGLTITRISDDAFQNIPAVYNCVVDDVDPLSTGAHADAWQHGMGNSSNKIDDNVIVYNLRATNLKYQSVFIRADIYSQPSYAQGMAFVNVYMQMRSDSHGWGGWYRWVDHMLWWHCTFAVKGMGIMPDTYAGTKYDCSIRNMSVRGCDFAFFGIGGGSGGIDFSDWSNNHFVDASNALGTNATTGDNRLDSYGIPLSDSPLLNRLSPVVPVDTRNNQRTGLADVGAYER